MRYAPIQSVAMLCCVLVYGTSSRRRPRSGASAAISASLEAIAEVTSRLAPGDSRR